MHRIFFSIILALIILGKGGGKLSESQTDYLYSCILVQIIEFCTKIAINIDLFVILWYNIEN